MGNQDVDSICEVQWFTEEGAVERFATCLVRAKSSHGNFFVAVLLDAVSSTWFTERMRHHSRMHRRLQFSNIARCSHSLKYSATGRKTNLVYCPVIKQDVQVRGMVPINGPSNTHKHMWHLRGSMMAVEIHPWRKCGLAPSFRRCSWIHHGESVSRSNAVSP